VQREQHHEAALGDFHQGRLRPRKKAVERRPPPSA
jgi:hypothetical protein